MKIERKTTNGQEPTPPSLGKRANPAKSGQASQQLHLCDFDGTLAKGDSFLAFLIYAVPVTRLMLGGFVMAFYLTVLFFTGNWSNEAAKAAVLSAFFKGKKEEVFRGWGAAFCKEKIQGLLRPQLLASLRSARHCGATVAIVSASPDVWLRPFCEAEGFGLICTELEFSQGVFFGKLATPNCNGLEKARRIEAAYHLASFEKIIAYGNSGGDEAMFALADEVFRF